MPIMASLLKVTLSFLSEGVETILKELKHLLENNSTKLIENSLYANYPKSKIGGSNRDE